MWLEMSMKTVKHVTCWHYSVRYCLKKVGGNKIQHVVGQLLASSSDTFISVKGVNE